MVKIITHLLTRIKTTPQKSLERKTKCGITPAIPSGRSILVTAGGLTWAMEV